MIQHDNNTDYPQLFTPESCLNSSRVRDFLRLSRMMSDDKIRQHINRLDNNVQCDEYFKEQIAPQWEARASLINYCTQYSHELRAKTEKGVAVTPNLKDNDEYDLRKDPYAIRNVMERIDEQFANCDSIDNWISNENTVEYIVKGQTIDILNDKCYYGNWMEKFKEITKGLK